MRLPSHKTKIVATIGPASSSPETLRAMVDAGLSIARLNFSHGTLADHGDVITRVRAVAAEAGRPVIIMADLPGPKMRIGGMPAGPVELRAGDPFTLTVEEIDGDARRVSTSFKNLPQVVWPGARLFLNDGLVQLVVEAIDGPDVRCRVEAGGPLSARKGINLPGIPLGIDPFTDRDRECLAFAISRGVEAVSQSFVESARDVGVVRAAAAAAGGAPFVIAKIERREAVERFDEILDAADGIMVARGDLGVEVPIHEIAVIQKRLIAAANDAGKPVITATQMLESMTSTRLPTRAEVADVANAILDGTDGVMLSAESAAGKYPVESVAMLAAIAASVEQFRESRRRAASRVPDAALGARDAGAVLISRVLDLSDFDAVVVPSTTGRSARFVARLRLPVWTFAVGPDAATMHGLAFSYGVAPVHCPDDPDDWKAVARRLARDGGLEVRKVILVAGPSRRAPEANLRIELMSL